ncbi:MAG: hypothetical protein MI862_05405 [Desulfobacterales bacterium]|nr:hypothetical protein [Desulfobacterales bacterium]
MSFEIAQSLNRLLESGFEQVRFRHTDKDPGVYIAPQFFIGAVPPRRKNNDPLHEERESNYPFICTRIVTGEDRDDHSLISLETICGTYTAEDDEAGHNEIANMMMRSRRLILEKQMLDNRFKLVLPLTWSIGDPREDHAQPHPNYEGIIKTTWNLPVIERTPTLKEEKDIYGA